MMLREESHSLILKRQKFLKIALLSCLACQLACASSEPAPYEAPKEYLPQPVYDFCLSEFDITVSLKVLNFEKPSGDNQLFTLSINPKPNGRLPVAPDKSYLIDQIGIGYVTHLNGFEVIRVNQLHQPEQSMEANGLLYEILAEVPDKAPLYSNAPDISARYQVVLTNWYHKSRSGLQCPVIKIKELNGLQVKRE